jgi:DNA-binding IclR family transcriptional regulator
VTSDHGVVRSLDRALSILDVLRYSSQPLALGEIAVRSGLPKSTTHRLLSTLEVRGFVLGAISLAGPAFRFTQRAAAGQAVSLRAAATRVRTLLGAEHPVPAVLRDVQ